MHGDDGAGDRRLDFVFHLHRFDDQNAVARLDLVADLDLDIDDCARHCGGDAAGMGRTRTLLGAARQIGLLVR